MALLDILHYPDKRLRKVAEAVEVVDKAVLRLIDDMFETMYDAPGIGLAATQINVHKRVIVIDISAEKNQPVCLINPEIIESDGVEVCDEGCLSIPDIYESIERAEHIKVQTLNEKGEQVIIETGGMLAVCIQHEMDHLMGKLFVDYLSPMKRQRIKKKLIKNKRLDEAV